MSECISALAAGANRSESLSFIFPFRACTGLGSRAIFSLALTLSMLSFLIAAPSNAQTQICKDRQSWSIGGVVALTGAASGWGEMARLGWQSALDEVNADGGILGCPVRLILEDSQTNPTRAVSAFRKLVEVDKVDAVVGDVWDFLTTPLIPLTVASKKVLVSTIIDQSTRQSSPYFFTSGPRISSISRAVQQFFQAHPQIKTVAILGWDNEWGYAYEGVWRDAATQAGAQIVATERTADLNTDWRAEITRIFKKHPDAVFLGYQADRIMKRLRELGMSPIILTTSNLVEELAQKTLSPDLSSGIYYTDWPPQPTFVTEFRAKHGRVPMLNATEGYEAMRSLLKAIAASPDDITVGMSKVTYQGVSGPIDFTHSASGNLSEASLFRVYDGEGRAVRE